MQLDPRISVAQAITGLLLAFVCIFLAFLLWRRVRQSRYPAREASILSLTFAFWLILNISADRLSNIHIAFPAGLMTYVAPLLILHAFIVFALHFPPKNSAKSERIILFTTTAGSAALCGIIFNPAPFLLQFDEVSRHLISVNIKWPYLLFIAWCTTLIILLIVILIKKWRQSPLKDKLALKIIGGSFLIAAFFALTFSIIEAYNLGSRYFFYYSYILSEVFAIGLAYAILKHGALDSSYTFSRQILITIGVTLLAVIVLSLLA
jgi:hypothetical protein